ncbi:bromodomain-containing protein [Cavenderia fasciculata]|uniref:Bromodomain-containing protein n=1 Tax=Cavenderia fasciculata TaxID=261658 RepID=F4Q4Y2_CACFS|nr:bromodomain-containing protein [Cavenderia fasciculata]EGG17088.1 bromodomain-containing protein [Cavenderia fasciculata]|eukprot:XP_004355572.1 bromodomain-containing protein [Cavenderia fasciculata]
MKRKEREDVVDDIIRDEEEYTEEELKIIYRQDICYRSRFKQLQQQTTTNNNNDTLKLYHCRYLDDSCVGVGGIAVLPWFIIERILTLASDNANFCTCVYDDALRDALEQLDHKQYKPNTIDTRGLAHLQMQPQIEQHSLGRQDMCPIHQYNYDMGYRPPPNLYIRNSRNDNPNISIHVDIDKRWKRQSLALKYCVIKNPTTLYLVKPFHYSYHKPFYVDNEALKQHIHFGGRWTDTISLVPASVDKLTFDNFPLYRSLPNYFPHIRIVRFKRYRTDPKHQFTVTSCYNGFNFNLTNINKIIIHSPYDILQSYVDLYNKIGYQFIGSSTMIDNNNNNYNSNSISTTNNNQPFEKRLPNYVMRNIISMVWNLRDRCTCIYEESFMKRLEQPGLEFLNDKEFVQHYHSIKNECAVHFSTTKLFTPQHHTIAESTRSKLQLALISKDIFRFVSNHLFNNIIFLNNNDFYFLDYNNRYRMHRNNPNCVFKTIRSLVIHTPKINYGFEYSEEDYQTITTIKYQRISMIPPSLELFSCLTKLDIRDCPIQYDALMFLDLAETLTGKSITKLYFPSRCVSAYSILSQDIKLSLRCIVTNLTQDVNLDEFPNLVALVVLDCSSTTIGQTLKLPPKIKKITTDKKAILILNLTTISTLKILYNKWDCLEILPILNQLSTANQITKVIIQIKSIQPLLDISQTSFQLDGSVSKQICSEGNVKQANNLIYRRKPLLQAYIDIVVVPSQQQQKEQQQHIPLSTPKSNEEIVKQQTQTINNNNINQQSSDNNNVTDNNNNGSTTTKKQTLQPFNNNNNNNNTNNNAISRQSQPNNQQLVHTPNQYQQQFYLPQQSRSQHQQLVHAPNSQPFLVYPQSQQYQHQQQPMTGPSIIQPNQQSIKQQQQQQSQYQSIVQPLPLQPQLVHAPNGQTFLVYPQQQEQATMILPYYQQQQFGTPQQSIVQPQQHQSLPLSDQISGQLHQQQLQQQQQTLIGGIGQPHQQQMIDLPTTNYQYQHTNQQPVWLNNAGIVMGQQQEHYQYQQQQVHQNQQSNYNNYEIQNTSFTNNNNNNYNYSNDNQFVSTIPTTTTTTTLNNANNYIVNDHNITGNTYTTTTTAQQHPQMMLQQQQPFIWVESYNLNNQ